MLWFILVLIVLAVAAFMFVPALKGYRTMVFGWATAIVGGVLPYVTDIFTYLNGLDWRQYLPEKYVPLALLFIGLVVVILRKVTTGPVGQK